MNSAAELLLEKAAAVDASPRVPSPCLSICRMDATRELCEGCFRTLEEIASWGMMRDAERREVWEIITQRALQP